MTSGVSRITVGVKDMAGGLSFFRDFVGMKIVSDSLLSPDYLRNVWNIPEDSSTRSVRLRYGNQPTILELVRFGTNNSLPIRAPNNTIDYGFYDLGFVVQNLDSIYGQLKTRGFSSLSDPVTYAPFGNLTREVIIIGPDGIPIVHLDRLNTTGKKPAYLRFNHTLVIVESLEPAIKFYRDVLGLEVTMNRELAPGMVDTILALPRGTIAKVGMVRGRDPDSLAILFMELSVKGKSLREVARPPNIGIFMLSFETDNLQRVISKTEAIGLPLQSGPITIKSPDRGELKVASLRCPTGLMVELFQKQ